ncbi:phospholipid-binding protein [Dictyostelium discoideum AX4]|uniref:Copine-D n=1 Tax=Dictyostelium discoideum TaxID=44689 RepID=CPND_DICDI|nr:phospholipid-binding protein [Dictyostelium discoideum AX4]Q55GG1.1 RecName: Full=Copine-D [Dictyostelium discoideum]EAL73297.1 phospholipid-binding protein [Dictyostelium discoideum AX4]|eukprot:XP_647223.1 phospholipid-binding protein [Dictyostelium discoideum AX4]
MNPIQPIPKSKIEIRIKCKDLTSKDLLSQSDPQAIVYLKQQQRNDWIQQGKTEKLKNQKSPEFKQSITVDYHFEEVQLLKIVVIDIDKDIKLLKDFDDHDLIGEVNVSLGSILSSPGGRMKMSLTKNGILSGSITISTEEIRETGANIYFALEGNHLDKKDLLSSDPYFKIYKSGGTLVYQSDVIKNTLNPTFPPVYLKLEELNGGDMFRELTFEFMDWDKIGDHDLIGRFTTNTDTILRGGALEFEIINPKKVGKSGYKNSGIIKFYIARIQGDPTFLDYLHGGLEINLMVAIDCTASNMPPDVSTSLHYNTPTQPSQYASSIAAVGNVLAPYDYDQMIEVVGFGGLYNGHTSHCFPFNLTNGDDNKSEAHGLQEVLDIYYNNVLKIPFSYPTNFENVIHHAIKRASKSTQSNQKYTVLLIITDGDISDTQKTIDELVSASKSALSVVIIGVGNYHFEAMKILDGDEKGLVDSKGNPSKRDICQFVPFNDFKNYPEALAHETLKEIPSQVLSFMKLSKIHPNQPRQFNC